MGIHAAQMPKIRAGQIELIELIELLGSKAKRDAECVPSGAHDLFPWKERANCLSSFLNIHQLNLNLL